ncbi:MAG: glycosyltransferase family 4 protein [Anaerolineae bacterium]|nr:glycosyltransferase family 4 protein [Anaerolineae bacterium]
MSVKSFRIGLNAHLLSTSETYRGAGISWYIVNLLRNLVQVSPEFLDYYAFLGDRPFKDDAALPRLHTSRLPTQRPAIRIFWEQCIQPLALRRTGVDLLHALAFVAPRLAPCPFVVTVYDLSFLRYSEAFRPVNRWYLKHFTTDSVRKARAVITISESTRRDVIDLLGAAPEKVHTIYCGVDASFRQFPAEQIAAFRAAQGLPDQFVLYLGTLEPRKNVTGLIRAYARWRERDVKAPPLIVAGAKGWYYDEIFQLVESLGLANAVRFPGYIPQESLPLWYNSASLFVYPSHFEGFGLPVLEAMACGTPVITSTASSLPEVTGTNGAARLVEPDDTAALAQALAEVMGQPDLRDTMSRQGRVRAATFSWQKTARETVAVYRKVLNV